MIPFEQLPISVQRKLKEFHPRVVKALFSVLIEDMEQEKAAKDLTPTA